MVTGIIQALGRVGSNHGRRLRLNADVKPLPIGSSVAVNGACLTLVRRQGRRMEFDLSPETLSLTNLGKTRTGDLVNLETSLQMGDALGGHLVSGHVDAKAKVLESEWLRDGFLRLRVQLPKVLHRLVARKGSIAIDGTSLTVSALGRAWFETVLIPHTLKETNLGFRKQGDVVNLEADLVA